MRREKGVRGWVLVVGGVWVWVWEGEVTDAENPIVVLLLIITTVIFFFATLMDGPAHCAVF